LRERLLQKVTRTSQTRKLSLLDQDFQAGALMQIVEACNTSVDYAHDNRASLSRQFFVFELLIVELSVTVEGLSSPLQGVTPSF
jgi:hypothetical protein